MNLASRSNILSRNTYGDIVCFELCLNESNNIGFIFNLPMFIMFRTEFLEASSSAVA